MSAVQEHVSLSPRFESNPFLRLTIDSPHKIVIAIGGHVDQTGEMQILKTLADYTGDGKLFVSTLASDKQQNEWNAYKTAFEKTGITPNQLVHLGSSPECPSFQSMAEEEGQKTLLVTGGNQKNFMDRAGEDGVVAIQKMHAEGGVVAGTSAGAAILGRFMIVGRDNEDSYYITEGLGLVDEVIVDQHFNTKPRTQRLKSATKSITEKTGKNLLGVGIDEDTAAVFVDDETLFVIGKNSVTIFDASKKDNWDREVELTQDQKGIHVLRSGDIFDLKKRQLKNEEQMRFMESDTIYTRAAA